MTAVVIPLYTLLPVLWQCRNVVAGCSNRPTDCTTFHIMTFHDEHKTRTDGDYRYNYPCCKHSTGLCGIRRAADYQLPDRE